MCCFSRPVQFVGSTRIFARFLDGVSQCVVYEMKITADEELAMILPIPVVQPAKEDAVVFHDLSGYPGFFSDLRSAFPVAVAGAASRSAGPFAAFSEPTLEVKKVGAFDASFVPKISDFQRLDARFRLEDDVWKSLPQYADYGFAVFKLRKGAQDVHPMAFRFPSALRGKIYFPTVHIHDGKVHDMEEFDHDLYAQAWQTAVIKGTDWEESEKNAGQFVKMKKSADLVWGGGHLYRKTMVGKFKNEDILAEARKLG